LGSDRTILIVEDSPLLRKAVRVTLEAEGYQVREAATAQEAIAAQRNHPSALILQDFVLPDMHGAELARALRNLPGGREVPILLLTGMMDQALHGGLEKDFTMVLTKPITLSFLIQIIDSIVPKPKRD
jgi:CheY-like chemotaxis protein